MRFRCASACLITLSQKQSFKKRSGSGVQVELWHGSYNIGGTKAEINVLVCVCVLMCVCAVVTAEIVVRSLRLTQIAALRAPHL